MATECTRARLGGEGGKEGGKVRYTLGKSMSSCGDRGPLLTVIPRFDPVAWSLATRNGGTTLSRGRGTVDRPKGKTVLGTALAFNIDIN